MFSFKQLAINRVLKRVDSKVRRFEKKNGRTPTYKELGKVQVLSFVERIWFAVVGLLFLYFAANSFFSEAWFFSAIFGPISLYVSFRGIFGRSLDVQSMAKNSPDHAIDLDANVSTATIESEFLKSEYTHFLAFFMVELFLSILVIIIEIIVTLLAAVASVFG